MYTRRDKTERKKRKKHPHTPRACHTLLLFFFFLLHRGRGRPAVKRSQVVTGRQATVIDASSPALCVCVPPPLFASSKALFCLPCCVLVFRLGTLLPPALSTVSSFTSVVIVCLCCTSSFIKNTTSLLCSRCVFFFLLPDLCEEGLRCSFHPCVCVCAVSVQGRVRV